MSDSRRSDAVLAQLYAMRAQLEAAIALQEAEWDRRHPSQAPEDEAGGCDHPEDQRQDDSTYGHRAFFCRRCRQTIEES